MLADNKVSSQAALDILDDQKWHRREDFFKLAKNISPEAASRAYVQAVPRVQRNNRKTAEFHIQVKYGRHRLVDRVLQYLNRIGAVETRGRGRDREYKICQVVSSCPCCGTDDPCVGPGGAAIYIVECNNCGLAISRDTKHAAVDAWNRRHQKKIKQNRSTQYQWSHGGGI